MRDYTTDGPTDETTEPVPVEVSAVFDGSGAPTAEAPPTTLQEILDNFATEVGDLLSGMQRRMNELESENAALKADRQE